MPKAAQLEILFSSYSVEMDLLEGPYLGLILFYYEVRNDRKESKERKEEEEKTSTRQDSNPEPHEIFCSQGECSTAVLQPLPIVMVVNLHMSQ